MRSFEQIQQEYFERNEQLAEGIRNADTTLDITPVTAATEEERKEYSPKELESLDMYATTHKNLIHMCTDEKYAEEKKLYKEVIENLTKMEHWFEALKKNAVLPSSQRAFQSVEFKTGLLKLSVSDAWRDFCKSNRTKDDVTLFREAVKTALDEAEPHINKNHDTSQELYYQFELCLKGFFESLIKLSNKIGKATGLSKGDTPEISTWVKPEKTTKVLFSEAMKNLGGFFTKKMPSAEDEDDKENRRDNSRDMN
ncbi:MAG: hypothetical protein P1U32_05310 [Legionellaceae bacterium]|nr:hypothetical protein [Legionellaceae bacterium]